MPCTIVLVHGAFAESASWQVVIEPLVAEGHRVVAAANPAARARSDAAAVSDLVRALEGPVVLVAHSYGGAVISNVYWDAGDVAGLVFVNGFAPDAGETCSSSSGRYSGEHARARRPRGQFGGATARPICTSRPERFHDVFCQDLPAAEAARGWPRRSARPPRRRSWSPPATAHCGRRSRPGS